MFHQVTTPNSLKIIKKKKIFIDFDFRSFTPKEDVVEITVFFRVAHAKRTLSLSGLFCVGIAGWSSGPSVIATTQLQNGKLLDHEMTSLKSSQQSKTVINVTCPNTEFVNLIDPRLVLQIIFIFIQVLYNWSSRLVCTSVLYG